MRNYTTHILERNVRNLNNDKAVVKLFLDIKSNFDTLRDTGLFSQLTKSIPFVSFSALFMFHKWPSQNSIHLNYTGKFYLKLISHSGRSLSGRFTPTPVF